MNAIIGLAAGAVLMHATLETTAPSAHRAEAARWMTLVDAGAYAQSWDEGGAVFQSRLSKPDWIEAVAEARRPLGPLVGRRLINEEHLDHLPGAPRGDYTIIHFAARYARVSDAMETVVLAHESEGWKVDGYFIR